MKIQNFKLVVLLVAVMMPILLFSWRSINAGETEREGLFIFTDFPPPNHWYSVDVFDLTEDRRYSPSLGYFAERSRITIIDEQYIFVDVCFATFNSWFCTGGIIGVISPDALGNLDVIRQLWQENYGSPVFSPDGSHIAFTIVNLGIYDTYVLNLANNRVLDLTPDEIDDSFWFSWSPDSVRIAFACSSGELLCIANTDGSDVQKMDIPENTTLRDIAWSPDGNQIVFSALDNDFRNSELYIVNSDGSNMFRLLEADANDHESPVWSPDSSKIVFRSGEQGNNIGEIYVIDRDGTNLQNLSSTLDGSEFGAIWSPDGTQIAFFSYQGRESMFLYITNADGTGLRQITKNSTWDLFDAGNPILFWLP
jgi:Tol biopolymer transport system component